MNMLSQIIIELTDRQSVRDDASIEIHALALLDDEVKAAASALAHAQENLSVVTTAYQTAQTKLDDIVNQIQTHERYAVQALDKNKHELALEVAEKIASLEQSQALIEMTTKRHASECEKLTEVLHHNEHNLYMLKQQIDTIKASQSVHRAQIAVCERYGDNHQASQMNHHAAQVSSAGETTRPLKLRTALDAMKTMKHSKTSVTAQQSVQNDVVSAPKDSQDANASSQSELPDQDNLLSKLQAVGIATHSKKAEDVLCRIKNKH